MKREIFLKKILLFSLSVFLAGCGKAMQAGQAQAAVAVQTHPFSVYDLLAMDRISEPQASPDGKWIVFTMQKTDLKADKGSKDLWLVGVDGSGLRQLTTHPENDFNPRWLPDGKTIYFISLRSGLSQVWKIAVDGGEATQVTKLPLDVGNLIISPDGREMAFTLEVFVDCNSPGCTKQRLEEKGKNKASGVVYDRLFVRHWDSWEDGRRSHIFVMPAAGGEAVDVMAGMDADCPSQPFGGTEEFVFTPDGKKIVFTAKCVPGSKEAWSTNFDIYRVPVSGSAKPECLTQANQATDTTPVFSPDGKVMAYLAMDRPGYESDRFRIVLRVWPGGPEQILTAKWDRSPSAILWSKDGKKIYATAGNMGETSLFAVDVRTGEAEVLIDKGTVDSPVVAGERIIFCGSNLKSPAEIYSVDTKGGDRRQITRLNETKVAAARMGDYEQFYFNGWNDEKVYCYVVKPADFDPNGKYPVAFFIHGGPQGSFGNMFHYRWNPQVFAGAGFAVVMVDFHGSTGYGQMFCDSIRGDWGGKPLEDLKKGLAAALGRFKWMDANRVGALGASFGGYMINWIEGNWPDRFRCLVNHDGDFDERMSYFDTEELWFPEWDLIGTPWENPQSYEKHNPVNFVQNWKTPMLVIHGGKDYRVSLSHGIGAFTALQRRGIESRLLYFLDESHWVLKPNNSILWHETVIGWLDKFLK